jgi:2-hydroxy-6-oxonona-2,4-dienedioate hydrolase
MQTRFMDVNGVRTRYHLAGDDSSEPLILLHGVGLSADTFVRNMEALGRHFRVYAPDLLGHGFTGSIDYRGGAPQPFMVTHLLKFADALGLSLMHVIGNSFGALIAALMYLQDPDRVETLILIGSASAFHPAEEQRKSLQAALQNGREAMLDPTLARCRQRLSNICYDAASVPDDILLVQLTSYALPDRYEAYEATVSGALDAPDAGEYWVYDRLQQIKVPTLILTGRNDIRSKISFHEKAHKRIPDSELVVFDRCGHLPFLEHSERFNELVVRFVSRAIDARQCDNTRTG